MARKLIGDPNLEFVAMPALAPPEVHMDPTMAAKYEQELEVCVGEGSGCSILSIVTLYLLNINSFYNIFFLSFQIAQQTALPDEDEDL